MNQLLRSCFALVLCLTSAWAVDWKALQPQGYVSDFAGVVDSRSREALERYCRTVETQTGAQMALVTLQSTQGEPVEDVANTIFRAWTVGQKGENNGIMLLLVTGDRRSRLEVGYGLEPLIPDGFAGSVLREMRPALRQAHYGEAMMAAAQVIGQRIAEAKQVSLDAPLPRRVRSRPRDSIPWPLAIGGIFLLFWLLGMGRRGGGGGSRGGGGGLLPGLLMGSMLGRGGWGSSRGGGGFGGFDSGGGFGGFGGGDSGGGGASSDW